MRFRVYTIKIVLAAALSIIFVIFSILCTIAYLDYRVISRVERLGGRVFGTYDYLPWFIREQLDGEHLVMSSVIGVVCECPDANDELACLLTRFQKINVLNLNDSRISRRGLECLCSLPHLQSLRISKAPITSADVEFLSNKRSIITLWLNDIALTDEAIQSVAQMPNLTKLHIENTSLTDSTIRHLRRKKIITNLYIGRNAVSDEGVAHLSECTSLYSLDLNDTLVSDSGLMFLTGLVEMKHLDVTGTRVTADGVAHLGRELLNCNIKWSGGCYTPGVGLSE